MSLLQRFLMWFACLLGAAGGCVLLGAPFYSAVQADRTARDREATVVANGVAYYVNEIARKSTPQIVWDEAVQNLDVSFNEDWARENIGAYFSETEALDAVRAQIEHGSRSCRVVRSASRTLRASRALHQVRT